MFSLGRKTKRQKEAEELEAKVDAERKRLLFILKKTDVFTPLLEPMIEAYIDSFRIYEIMYKRWSDKGFPETETYTNKAGATNKVKHPLSVQVDIWSEKKMKALEKLGMTNKSVFKKVITGGTTVDESTGHAEKEPESSDNLLDFNKKWGD